MTSTFCILDSGEPWVSSATTSQHYPPTPNGGPVGAPTAVAIGPRQAVTAAIQARAKTNAAGEAGVLFMPCRAGGDRYRMRIFLDPVSGHASEGTKADAVVCETGRFVRVADPRPGGGSLVLRIKPPSGAEQTVTMGPLTGGVRPQLVNLSVLPRATERIDFELGLYFPITEPGRYTLVLEYTWKPGQTWRSPELGLTVDPK